MVVGAGVMRLAPSVGVAVDAMVLRFGVDIGMNTWSIQKERIESTTGDTSKWNDKFSGEGKGLGFQ